MRSFFTPHKCWPYQRWGHFLRLLIDGGKWWMLLAVCDFVVKCGPHGEEKFADSCLAVPVPVPVPVLHHDQAQSTGERKEKGKKERKKGRSVCTVRTPPCMRKRRRSRRSIKRNNKKKILFFSKIRHFFLQESRKNRFQ